MFMLIESHVAQAVGLLVATDTNLCVTDIQSTVGNLASSVSMTYEGHCDGDICLPLLRIDIFIHHAIRSSSIYSHARIFSYILTISLQAIRVPGLVEHCPYTKLSVPCQHTHTRTNLGHLPDITE